MEMIVTPCKIASYSNSGIHDGEPFSRWACPVCSGTHQNTEQARRLNVNCNDYKWPRNMVLGYHIVFGTYGFWLPNDPRGSWSDFVASWELFQYGDATKTSSRKSVAGKTHNYEIRKRAKRGLKFPEMILSGRQDLAVSRGFNHARKEGGYRIYACAILPEHVHMVIARHDRSIGRIIGHLKARATQQLRKDDMIVDKNRPIWAEKSWKVYLDSSHAIKRAITYTKENPVKEEKSQQSWSFVEPYQS